MIAFVWDRNFLTGLPVVDQQHHELVDLFNRLSDSLTDGSGICASALEDTFAALRNYTQYHFVAEEKLMAAAGIDARHQQAHLQAHRGFIEHLASLWNSRSAMSNPSQTFVGFLSPWLAMHILRVDKAMARQLALIENGEAPARAYELDAGTEDAGITVLLNVIHTLYSALSRQNVDLAVANMGLEVRVRERTLELERANAALSEANHQLEVFSRQDGLLGIANRSCFDERFGEEWRRARRAGAPLALLMIDVDHFKRYNDSHGHQAGDRCLRAIAQTVADATRRAGDLVARYGGEELIVMLPGADRERAREKAEQICQRIGELAIEHGRSSAAPYVTVSIGVAAGIPAPESLSPELIARADQALYKAKAQGRNQVCVEGDA